MSRPGERLHLVGEEAADRLVASSPLALLVGFALDQQVTVQKAFGGPRDLRERLGHLDAARIAAMDPAELAAVFARRPALHRFPAAMAGRVQALCAVVAERYGNDAGRLWREARDGADLRARILDLPGFGEMKAGSLLAVLVKQLGVDLPGAVALLPSHATLGDVDSPAALAAYQAGKRAQKAAARAADKPV
jgi:uncharacterized HhH-GPD family protein